MMKYLVALVLFVSTVHSQERRCAAPGYFQARVHAYDHETGYFVDGRMSYDAHNERFRIIEKVNENATRPQVDELILHHMKKRFRVDLKTRKCNVSAFDYPFHRIETPENARPLPEVTIGSPSEVGTGVVLRTWTYEVHDHETGIQGNGSISFTREECVPLSDVFYGYNSKTKKEVHYHRSFFDLTIGLDDPNVFEIPPECNHM